MKKLLLLFAIAWLPLAAWCADGDTFTDNTVEGVAITFMVTSEANKQCQVGTDNWNSPAVNSSTTGTLTIQSVVNGYSVTSIGKCAFPKCTGLTSVNIPNSVTSIGESAFELCSSLTSVTNGSSVESIGARAFSGCSGLTSVTIPNSVESIGDYAFSGCNGLTSITIGNSVKSIRVGAFSGCSGLTSIFIPSSVTSIEYWAFSGCIGLTSITVENGNTVYDSRGNCNAIIQTGTNILLVGCKNTVIPSTVASIGNYAFYGCTGLPSITIPNSVTSIGDYAFSCCSGLTTLTISNPATTIGDYAFYGCSGLSPIPTNNNVTSISPGSFGGCKVGHCGENVTFKFDDVTKTLTISGTGPMSSYDIKAYGLPMSPWYHDFGSKHHPYSDDIQTIIIEDGVTSIGSYAFYRLKNLTSITIPSTVTRIDPIPEQILGPAPGWRSQRSKSVGQSAFLICDKLSSIVVDPDNPVYDSRDNCNAIIITNTNELILGCNNTIIPNSVRIIGHSAFQCFDTTSSSSIIIPEGVTFIGENAFSGLNLASVTIPSTIGNYTVQNTDGSTTTYNLIGPMAFNYNLNLEVHSKIKNPYNLIVTAINPRVTLYVPVGTKAKYQNRAGWPTNIVEEIYSIAKAEVTLSGTSFPYTGSAIKPTITSVTLDGGTLTEGTDFTVSYQDNTDAGMGQVILTGLAAAGYKDQVTATFTIEKVASTIPTPPAAPSTLYYTGEDQELIPAIQAEGGEVQYSVDGSDYSTDIPKGKDKNTYTIRYKVVGDKNHTDIAEATLTVSIVAKELTAQTSDNPSSKLTAEVTHEANKTAELTSVELGTGATTVTIPPTIQGYTLTGISSTAFDNAGNVQVINMPQTNSPIPMGNNTLPAGADIQVPLALLADYALNPALKPNFEAGKVKATVAAANNWFTLSAGVDVLLPDGVTAYAAKQFSNTQVAVNKISDAELAVNGKKVIKANNGVLLKGTKDNSYSFVAIPGTRQSGDAVSTDNANSYSDNQLVPVIVPTNFPAGQYYALKDDNFHPLLSNSSKVPAGKAVLKLNGNAARVLSIIGGNATGISEMETMTEGEDEKWYDLRGSRIGRPTKKGLYIQNGKKFVVK